MSRDELMAQTAATVINEMLNGSFFSICAVDQAAKLLGIRSDNEEYKILLRLHCVHWKDMPRALRDEIPNIVMKALSQPPFRIEFNKPRPMFDVDMSVVSTQQAEEVQPRRGLLKLLMGGK